MQINNVRVAELAEVKHSNSMFTMPFRHQTTIKTGDLVPIDYIDCTAGDVFKFDITNVFARMTTPIFAVMDSAYLDVFYFYVPYRILYENFEQFLGCSGDDEYGIQENEYFLPSVYNIKYDISDIASYFDLPTKNTITKQASINTLAFRAYARIYNDWFRNENLIEPYEVKTNYEQFDYNSNEQSLSPVSKLQYGKGIAKVAKLHDLFTSALPFTQKGPTVKFNFDDDLPLSYYSDKPFNVSLGERVTPYGSSDNNYFDIGLDYVTGGSAATNIDNKWFGIQAKRNSGDISPTSGDMLLRSMDVSNYGPGIITDLKNTALGVSPNISFSINELRTAFQMQRFYEALARAGGSRFNEFIMGIFGVDILDSTIQRPHLICSTRHTINMQQVVQTSSTDNVSPQGNVSGMSAGLYGRKNMGSISIKEPGIIIGLICVRTNQTYTEHIPRFFRKLRKFDFYYPQFQAIGEQGIKNSELYYSGNDNKDDLIFGYQEAWYEYRNRVSYVSGEFKNDNGAFASYTYASYFSDTPILNSDFITETDANVKRTLAVQDGPDFLVDFYSVVKASRPLPLYSIPGLIDHF